MGNPGFRAFSAPIGLERSFSSTRWPLVRIRAHQEGSRDALSFPKGQSCCFHDDLVAYSGGGNHVFASGSVFGVSADTLLWMQVSHNIAQIREREAEIDLAPLEWRVASAHITASNEPRSGKRATE